MSLHTFEIRAPQAKKVCLAGSFNAWEATALPMKRAANGSWALALELEPGRHEFKFVVDGAWCCEPGCDGPHAKCPGCVPNDMGTMNRVVDVAHERAQAAPKVKATSQQSGQASSARG
ncbi:MAG: glycogen-binding domain-containing protein [Planctomycetota bacterium]